ncbi:MAG: rod shape-determining protein MreC [Endozoicomonadaceae bacterium]|nr:rod shape-determining protein MreC [Endozoicomonadaceae bacterium]
MNSINDIFIKRAADYFIWEKFIFLMALSIVLIVIDHRGHYLDKPKSYMTSCMIPLYWIADIPEKMSLFWQENWLSRLELAARNEQLKVENLLLKQKIQTFLTIDTQNESLRALLHSSKNLDRSIKVAEIIGENPQLHMRQLIVDKGSKADVFLGQPLLDATGVMGHVISVNDWTSVALLLTDASSRIPIQVHRTGYRAIAAGNHPANYLSLLNISQTTDIQVGDLLVTSGLGGRFPPGYPVAEVFEKKNDLVDDFIQIRAKPLAKLNESRIVLLVYPEQNNHMDALQ